MVVVETKDLVTDTSTWSTYDRQQLLVSHKKLKCMYIKHKVTRNDSTPLWKECQSIKRVTPPGLILPISIHTPGPSCSKDG